MKCPRASPVGLQDGTKRIPSTQRVLTR